MAENVKVIVRCRPMNKREKEMDCKCVVKMKNPMIETWDPNEESAFPKQFTFDSVYDRDSNTEAIYNDICYPLIESVLEGYNSTVFVYGQTGCGKSFTMSGVKDDPSTKGVISRAFEHIFEAISVTSGVKYLALVSYLEIYNEQIRDLLLPNHKISLNSTLNLKEIPNEGVIVPGLTTHAVQTVAECEKLLNDGGKNRMVGATLMNEQSSRSHSIFTISIEQISHTNNNECIRKGKLNLVDLAGSERQAKTGATGDRLKEATKINLSLSALGNVISALVDGKAKHIPYRDSKLTRLLQDSLGGNTRTLMIACISPASRDYVETLSTLRYANRAKNISNKPVVNEDPKDTILRKYQEEIEQLKMMLENQHNSNTIPYKIEEVGNKMNMSIVMDTTTGNKELDSKRDRLIEEYQEEMLKFKGLHENEKSQKEDVLRQIQIIKEDYQKNLDKLNMEMQLKNQQKNVSKEEILKRIEDLKAVMIGGEKANDKELSEKRKRKKIAAEKRLNTIAHVLAKMETEEDREILQNQYKDISQELALKSDALRKYRHKVKSLEKEISDLHSEFEAERQDYLETVRKQDKNIKLLSQICEKISATLKKECNYKNLEGIKDQAIWLDESQRFRLPELVIYRTKLPPAGRIIDIQTAPPRLESDTESICEDVDQKGLLKGKLENARPIITVFIACRTGQNNSTNSSENSDQSDSSSNEEMNNETGEKLERTEKEDIIGSYFKPLRATELLKQSRKNVDPSKAFNTWKDFAVRNKTAQSSQENLNGNHITPPNSNTLIGNLNNLWVNGSTVITPDSTFRKPLRLEALPAVGKRRKDHKLNTLDLI